MRPNNNRKKEILFRAIGEIDDRLLHEAAVYRPQERSVLPRVLLIAATLSLAMALSVGAFLVSLRNDEGNATPDAPNRNEEIETNGLDAVLLNARERADYTTVESAEALDYFSGNAYVVWQYEDSQTLCLSRALTDKEVNELTAQIDQGTEVGEVSPALSCKVWILLGDGTVVSPYLKSSAGNTASGVLFDYNAELMPTERLNSCISKILE